MKKKTLAVLIVLCTGIALCFANGTAENADDGKNITLSVWTGYPELEPFYKHAAAEYKKTHPNVTVTVLSHPLREFEQKLSATIPSQTASDIIEASIDTTKKFIDAGLISPNPDNVVDFMTVDGRYSDFVLSCEHFGDSYYGLPFFLGRTALYYNKDMFAAAGIQDPPSTLAEMAEDAKKLAKYDAAGNLSVSGHSLRLSGSGSGIAEKFWFILYPMGGTIIEKGSKPNTYHAGYDNQAGCDALDYYLDALYGDKWDSPKIKHDAEAFELEKTAMFFRESWVIGDIAQKNPDLDYGTVLVPSARRWGRITSVEGLYTTQSCKNPEQAWDFILFCESPEMQTWLLDNVGWLPARADISFADSIEKVPQFEAFLASPEGYGEYGYVPIGCIDEIMTKFAERLTTMYLDESLYDNEAGQKAALASAAEETNRILKEAGLYSE